MRKGGGETWGTFFGFTSHFLSQAAPTTLRKGGSGGRGNTWDKRLSLDLLAGFSRPRRALPTTLKRGSGGVICGTNFCFSIYGLFKASKGRPDNTVKGKWRGDDTWDKCLFLDLLTGFSRPQRASQGSQRSQAIKNMPRARGDALLVPGLAKEVKEAKHSRRCLGLGGMPL